ncbi:MAG: YCF48-related protein [Candidatus Poribacteria bacterium]
MKSITRVSLLGALLGVLLLPQFARADWAISRGEDYDAEIDLRGIAFLDDDTGWAVGDKGTILHTVDGGHTWEPQAMPEPSADVEERFRNRMKSAQLVRVLIADESTVWILGNGVLLGSTDAGATWRYSNAGTRNRLTNGVFLSAEIGFIVGDNRTIVGTWDGGGTWESVFEGRRARAGDNRTVYEAIAFMTPDIAWIVGSSSTVVRSEDGGRNWAQPDGIDFDAYGNVYGVTFLSETEGWAVGQEAMILHTTDAGEYWEPVENDAENFGYDLKDFAFSEDGSQAWVVGDGGTILHTSDGGETWPAEESSVNHDLKAVAVTPSGTAYVVGAWGVILQSAPTGIAGN